MEFWQEALNHPSYDAFWKTRSTFERLSTLHVPAFIVGGWYDNYVEGDLEAFEELSRHSAMHRVLIGPWAHNMSLPFPSGISFGRGAVAPTRRYQLEWFQHWMRTPQPAPPFSEPPVRIFVMGVNRWRDEQEWPLRRASQTRVLSDEPGRRQFGCGRRRTDAGRPEGMTTMSSPTIRGFRCRPREAQSAAIRKCFHGDRWTSVRLRCATMCWSTRRPVA